MTVTETKHHDWTIGSRYPLSARNIRHLIRIVDHGHPEAAAPVLGGRAGIMTATIQGIGKVVIKPYRRGGVIRHLVQTRHLNMGHCRARGEFKMMEQAETAGVKVPEPVLYLQTNHILCRCWLATKQISGARSVATISLSDPEAAAILMPQVMRQVREMVTAKIFHVDLHPGNILTTPSGNLYVIDFDKAHFTKCSRARLYEKYTRRWNRAIFKHQLPEMLETRFS